MQKIELNKVIIDKDDDELTYKWTIIGEGETHIKLNMEETDMGDKENTTVFLKKDRIRARNESVIIFSGTMDVWRDALEWISTNTKEINEKFGNINDCMTDHIRDEEKVVAWEKAIAEFVI